MEKTIRCADPSERKLTWGEIRAMIEAAGVKPADEIDKIDVSWGSVDEFTCNKDDVFGWQIRL